MRESKSTTRKNIKEIQNEKKKELKESRQDLREQIQNVVEAYVLGFDPCKYCKKENRAKKENLEECLKCCFYYPSKFEVNDGN